MQEQDDVFDANDLSPIHRFSSTGEARGLAILDSHTVLAVGDNNALFLDIATLQTTKRRPGRSLDLVAAPFGPLVVADDGNVWRPNPDHTFARFDNVTGRPWSSWIDRQGRLWIARDRPDDYTAAWRLHLDVYTVHDDGLTFEWSRSTDGEAHAYRRPEGVWIWERTGRMFRPSPDGDEEIEDWGFVDFLTRNATDNYNVVAHTLGVLALGSDCETYVARID